MENKTPRIEIKHVKADEVSFVNRLAPGETIQLGFKYTYNIIYSGGDSGRAEMTLVAENQSAPDNFRLRVVETGIFTCAPGLPREVVHVAARISSASGVPAVMIPEIDLDASDVMRIDYKPPKKENEE